MEGLMERQIVLDTETTGLDPRSGDRLVEIAGVEIFNLVPTGQTFHAYIDPERDMPEEAYRIHGLSRDFLTGKPKFADIAGDFVEFVGDAKLVIHNADFDMKFINAELERTARTPISMKQVIDTLAIARRKHPGAPNSLDALCSRYRIDNSHRTKHGALLDAELLAEVYLELMGGRQSMLALAAVRQETFVQEETVQEPRLTQRPAALPSTLAPDERAGHSQMIESIGIKAIWNSYLKR
ncbi:MAG: DNA polymerase III subunit epsilon [Alphaproteobacteria bacterium]|nr:DNA polymerase III subunit epsilon [Alphaproteobacteria bacterium]